MVTWFPYEAYSFTIGPQQAHPIHRADDTRFRLAPSQSLLTSALSTFVSISPCKDSDLEEVSAFFVDEFFLSGGPGAGHRVRDQLRRDQLLDWKKRYGSGRPEAKLFVARQFGTLVGCVSVSASQYKDLGSDGRPRDPNNPYPKRDKQSKVPLLANLVVSRNFRRRGIAQKLAKICETTSKKWGYKEVRLYASFSLPSFFENFMPSVLRAE